MEEIDRAWLDEVERRDAAVRTGRADPIVEEFHQDREPLLADFDGDADALMEDCNRRVASGEFGDFKISDRQPVQPQPRKTA